MSEGHAIKLEPAGYAHPLVQEFVNIKRNKRAGADLLALDGLWAIQAAIAAFTRIKAVFVCPALVPGDEAARVLHGLGRDVARLELSERVLRRIAERDGPDGLAAVAYLERKRPSDIVLGPASRVAIADGLELPGNLGTVIRCADGSGAAAVVVSGSPLKLTNPTLIKASMGTLLSVPVMPMERDAALEWLRAGGFRVIAADPQAKLSYRDADYGGRVALVIGSERHGLGSFWRRAADVEVSIPMMGMADSLNVGHAAALLLYEALHRQLGDRR